LDILTSAIITEKEISVVSVAEGIRVIRVQKKTGGWIYE